MTTTTKLSMKTKIGYGLCTGAEAIPSNLLNVYFVFFLTDIVGIRAFLAGLILFVVVLWDSLIDPIIGGLSDNHVTEKGRRLTWMRASLLPLAVVVFLMFSPFTFVGVVGESIYYVLVAILVCTSYSAFIIPYFAMGGEITKDYSERNNLRFISTFFYYPIFLLAASGPMLIWEWASELGYTDREAWGFTGAIFAVLLLIICGVGLFLIRNCEKDSIKTAIVAKKKRVKESYLKIWGNCLRIKSFRKIIIWIFVYMLSVSMLNTVVVFFMTHNVGMSESEQALFWVVFVGATVVFLPVVTKFCNIFGKKPVMLFCMSPCVIAGFILFFTGINSMAIMYLYTVLYVLASSSFFAFYIGYAYDCVEIDEFKSGVRKDGSMSSLASFAQQCGMALSLPFTGLYLELTGYDGMAATQTDSALQGILTLATLFPSILALIALFILFTYPVSKKKYELLSKAIENKNNNLPYSTDGFEDLF
ncbi:MAG: MFS transporter [Oscillospiraceae bacterium]|jgi:GPH family glycoside/pentoside/hexuronide:cation symporter|nr:MFS transporter [Oscillospiraceae bacterium]